MTAYLMKHLYKLLCLTMLLASAVHAESITTIQLLNRPAEEIIPIVKPMLGPGDAITGKGFKLFLRSSPQTLAQIQDMIGNLDIAANMLQISIFQGSERELRALNISGNVEIKSGATRLNIGANKNTSAGNISYSTGNASGSINTTSTHARLENNPIHRLRVTEGTEAYIETGEQIPYFSGISGIVPDAAGGGSGYTNVTTGFYVLPRIHGDNVTLQVSPFKNTPSKAHGGSIETLHANTTISGPIGEWLLIGGTTEQIKRSQSSIGSYSSTQSRNNASVWIKADLVQ